MDHNKHNMDHNIDHNMAQTWTITWIITWSITCIITWIKKRDHNANHKSIHGSWNWSSILIFNPTNEKGLYFDLFDGIEGINERQLDLE